MDLQTLGRYLIVLAVALGVTGLLFLAGGRLGLGSLPGDIRIQRDNFGCFVPIATSIVLSLILTLVLNLLWRWFR